MERLWHFVGGDEGQFRITSTEAIIGETLPVAPRLWVSQADPSGPSVYALRGVTSNERYVTKNEKGQLVAKQTALGRPEATAGALIPIKKRPEWWALSQDDRRAIFEDRSQHIAIGLAALPTVARRLHHCRDMGTPEPFDFLTWFDFAPSDSSVFDDLLGALRRTTEWEFVEREVEIRVVRES